ncbi:MAG: ComEC/Rec2 family competence protein [Cryomorphaceae bacterium]
MNGTGLRNRVNYIWERVPMLRLIGALLLGIVLAMTAADVFKLWTALGSLVALVCMAALKLEERIRTVCLLAAVVCVGYAFTCLHSDRLFAGYFGTEREATKSATLQVSIAEQPDIKTRTIRCIVNVDAMHQEGTWRAVHGRLLLYLDKDSTSTKLNLGDEIMLVATIKGIDGPRNPGGFDYKSYMGYKNVHYQAYATSRDWRFIREGSFLQRVLVLVRRAAYDRLVESALSDEERAVLAALLFGKKDGLDSEQTESFAQAGAMHVLAVSGLHVGIIYWIVASLLKPLQRLKHGERYIAIVALVVLWGYAVITGLSASVTRAATMFTFVALSNWINRKSHILNTIVASAFFLLLFNPFLLRDVGFQLSYCAVIAIVLIQPKIEGAWTPKSVVLRKVWSLSAVSIAAQVGTFPIALYYFHLFPNYFLLTNLVVIPLAMVILPAGIALLIFGRIGIVSTLLESSLQVLLTGLNEATKRIAELPNSTVGDVFLSPLEVVLLFAVLWLTAAFAFQKRMERFIQLLCVLIAFNSMQAWRIWQQRTAHELVFYSLRQHNAVLWRHGRKAYGFHDEAMKVDSAAWKFDILPHWKSLGLQKVGEMKPPSGVLKLGPWRLLAMEKHMQIKDTIRVDVLWVKEATTQAPEEIMELAHTKQIVLSGALTYGTREEWRQIAERNNLPVADLYHRYLAIK